MRKGMIQNWATRPHSLNIQMELRTRGMLVPSQIQGKLLRQLVCLHPDVPEGRVTRSRGAAEALSRSDTHMDSRIKYEIQTSNKLQINIILRISSRVQIKRSIQISSFTETKNSTKPNNRMGSNSLTGVSNRSILMAHNQYRNSLTINNKIHTRSRVSMDSQPDKTTDHCNTQRRMIQQPVYRHISRTSHSRPARPILRKDQAPGNMHRILHSFLQQGRVLKVTCLINNSILHNFLQQDQEHRVTCPFKHRILHRTPHRDFLLKATLPNKPSKACRVLPHGTNNSIMPLPHRTRRCNRCTPQRCRIT